jgi:hypothetical protein
MSTNTSVARGQSEERPSLPFRFRDLPCEVKMMIYACFTKPSVATQEPPHSVSSTICSSEPKRNAQDRRRILETRKSLFLVSHEVSNQWTPIFFKDAIVWANSPSSRHRASTYKFSMAKCSSAKFDRVFLKSTAGYKLSCIRKLTFNGALRDGLETHPRHLDHAAIEEFVTVLQRHRDSLPSLEWVQLFAYLNYTRARVPCYEGPGQEAIFSRLDERGKLQQLQEQLRSNGDRGLLYGWAADRSVSRLDKGGKLQQLRERLLSKVERGFFHGWKAERSVDLRDGGFGEYLCSAIRLTFSKGEVDSTS